MSSDAAIACESLVKRFKGQGAGVTAIDSLSFEVKRGETFGLIGPDGAGKSTTTRVILGLLRRDGGASSVLGYDSTNLRNWESIYSSNLPAAASFQFRYAEPANQPARFYRLSQTPGL